MTDWTQYKAVEQSPHKISGTWTFIETRVPVYTLFENLESGAIVKKFLEWCPEVEVWRVASVLRHEAESLKSIN